tara:strand:- start:472 stop:1086 length:615 start_codon:yes stop_codon:yes gene_type:complete
MKIGIINFNSGNLYSIKKSIKDLGYDPCICNDIDDLKNSEKIILPGVGSFSKAIEYLDKFGFVEALNDLILKKNVPILGICLGMQLFCNSGKENKLSKGLSFIDAEVLDLKEFGCNLKLPHIGWNNIQIKSNSSILKEIPNNADFYFVHNFAVKCKNKENIVATTDYGIEFVSMFQKDNIYGVQFHPEKSSEFGYRLIKNFLQT